MQEALINLINMQFQLYLANTKYEKIAPINLSTGGIQTLMLTRQVSQARELQIIYNTLLEDFYEELQKPEAKLVLDIDGYSIGFNKSVNIVTDLFIYANIGAGSDFNSCVLLSSGGSDPNYPITSEFLTDNNKKGYFIKNTQVAKTIKKSFYKIKAINLSNLQENNITNIYQAQNRLYNEGVNYLKSKEGQISIGKQTKHQNGVVDITFYSSSLDLATEKRKLPVNQDYSGPISALINDFSDCCMFDIIHDVNININTGTYSNFELLNELTKNKQINWREVGLKPTISGYKTLIQIGDFDLLPSKFIARKIDTNNWFDPETIHIKNVTENPPSFNIEFDTKNQFILEGENIYVEYQEFVELPNTEKKTIFKINQNLNYKKSETLLLTNSNL